MRECPNAANSNRPAARGEEEAEVREAARLIRKRLERGGSFEDIEDQTVEYLRKVGLEVIQQELEANDPAAKEIRFDGQLWHRALRCEKEYLSSFGSVKAWRTLYRGAGRNTPTICPLELTVGVVDGFWLPRAARLGVLAMADLTAQDAQRLFAAIGLMCPSASSLGRLPTTVSQLWEEQRELHERMLRDGTALPARAAVVCASVDGVMVPLKAKAGQRQVKREAPGKHGSGPSGYREIGCGTISLHDDEGERLHTLYHGRMPEARKATLHQQLAAEMLAIAAARPQLRRTYLADGAASNWQIAASMEAAVLAQCKAAGTPYQAAVEVVDFYHACEHLKRGLDAVFGEGSTKGKVEFEKLKAKLKEVDGGVDLVITALRYRQRRAKSFNQGLDNEITYFTHQRSRMKYAQYQRACLPIASGVVEAACKTLVAQRMKRSGMAWSQAGGQAILTLRAWLRSETFDAAWRIVSNCVKTTALQPDTYAAPRLRLAA